MFKKYLKFTILTSLVTVSLFYISVQFLIYKANKEIELTQGMTFTIHQLKDLHTICVLDYRYNTADKKMLEECKKIEKQIITSTDNYYVKTPYLNFYKKYFY